MSATIPDLVRHAGREYGDAHAVEEDGVVLTFAELAALCDRAGRAFRNAGVTPGDRVAIWAPNMREWIVAAVGAQAAGGVFVPLNTRFKRAEAEYIVRRSGAKLLCSVGEFLGTDYAAMAAELPVERVLQMRSSEWDAFLASGSTGELPRVAPDDLSDILFTSGTTGHPKGVMTTYAQNLRAFGAWSDVVGLRAGDRYLIVNPFFHAFGYKAGWLAAILRGATILPHPVFDASAVLARIGRDRVSMLPGPPALFQSILAHPDRADYDLSSLRLAVTGAASIPVELIRRMRDELGFETVITGYGLTEACGIATMCRHDDDPETIAKTSGRAIPDVEVLCVDDAGAEVARGEPGEVVVRGYNVMRGYLDDPEATAAAVDAGGWLHTGDIGVMDERGYLRITDRKKDMFIVGGFNCYPAEIENLILGNPAVAQVAVIGVPDDRLGEVPMAYVVPAPGAELAPDALIAWCRDSMANYKVPRRVEIVDALPMNATGKVTKFALRERAAMFATVEEEVLGERMQVFARRAPSLRALVEHSRSFGDREFLVFGDRRISFAEHAGAVASVARALRERYGVGKGDRVAILAANCPEWIVAFWATVSLGGIAVAMNGWWAGDEIRYALGHSEPKVLIGDRKRLDRIRDAAPDVPIVEIETSFKALWDHAPGAPLPDEPIDEDAAAVILYTSGTTGRPKGVVHTHRNMIALLGIQFFHGARLAGATPPDAQHVRLTSNPLFHVSGLHAGVVAHLAAGIKSVWTVGRFDPVQVLELIDREGVNGWGPQGSMAFRVLECPERARFDTSSVTSIGCGGAPVTRRVQAALREAFPNAALGLAVGYGLTEGTALATINYGRELQQHPDSVGRPLPTVEVDVRDGEIYLRGPLVMKEYWRDPEATAAAIGPGRWLRTGDLGELRDGRLYVDTRRDDLILRAAENVYPAEVESRLEEHPDVAEAAVVGVDHEELGQEVMAVVVARPGARVDFGQLATWVGAKLAAFKVPTRWELRAEPLPRNASGKVMKYALASESETCSIFAEA